MKIFLSPSNQDGNRYAYGNTTERDQCGRIAEVAKSALERCGFECMLMHDESMADKVRVANNWGADYYIPIHTNAFNGSVMGTRMFYYSEGEKGHQLTKCIFNRLAPITPGTSENIKQNLNLYELKYPNAWTSYIEVEFHDAPDGAKWIIENTDAIAEAICMGVCDHCGVAYVPAEPAKETLYRVQVGAFRVKDNAERMLRELKKVGYDGFVVEVPR